MRAVIHEPGFLFFIEQNDGLLDFIKLIHNHRLAQGIWRLQRHQPDLGTPVADIVENQGIGVRIQFDVSRRTPNRDGLVIACHC